MFSTIYILLIGGLSLTIGDLFAGKYIKSKTKLLYALVMIFYIIGLNFLIYSYKFENIAVASIMLEIFNVVTLTIAGKFLFKENITKSELCGIIIGLIAVIIL
jgi:multidrug transporter EmrE-like cation transporter